MVIAWRYIFKVLLLRILPWLWTNSCQGAVGMLAAGPLNEGPCGPCSVGVWAWATLLAVSQAHPWWGLDSARNALSHLVFKLGDWGEEGFRGLCWWADDLMLGRRAVRGPQMWKVWMSHSGSEELPPQLRIWFVSEGRWTGGLDQSCGAWLPGGGVWDMSIQEDTAWEQVGAAWEVIIHVPASQRFKFPVFSFLKKAFEEWNRWSGLLECEIKLPKPRQQRAVQSAEAGRWISTHSHASVPLVKH